MDPVDYHRRLLSLYRFFTWAIELRKQHKASYSRHQALFEAMRGGKGTGSFEQAAEADMYLSLWFSVLYVVIEGWPLLRQRDDNLTRLLRSPNKDLLRDFRNASLHPADYADLRIEALVEKGQESYDWANEVTDAFAAFFTPLLEADREQRIVAT